MRLQEFVMRDFRAAGPELHHVHDVERQPSQLRQAPGKPRLAAPGISEHRHLFTSEEYDQLLHRGSADGMYKGKRAETDSLAERTGFRTLGPRKPLTPDRTLRTALAWSPPARATLPASTSAFEAALP